MSTAGGAAERITSKSGKHDTVVSPMDTRRDVYSYVNRPPDLFLVARQPVRRCRKLTVSPSADGCRFPGSSRSRDDSGFGRRAGSSPHLQAERYARSVGMGRRWFSSMGRAICTTSAVSGRSIPGSTCSTQSLRPRVYGWLDSRLNRGSDGTGRDCDRHLPSHGRPRSSGQVECIALPQRDVHIRSGGESGLYGGSLRRVFITLMALLRSQSTLERGRL